MEDLRKLAEETIPRERMSRWLQEYLHRLRQACRDAADALEQTPQEAARGRYCVEYGGWLRDEGKTYLMVPVLPGADLSCIATVQDAIDAAIEKRKGSK